MNKELHQRIDRIHSICGAWGLYEPGNSSVAKQQLKAVEEIGEIANWHLKGNKEEVMDGIGDVFVCWVNAEKLGGRIFDDYSFNMGVDAAILNLDARYPCISVLEDIAKHYDLTLLECIDAAIEVISKRKGRIINGAFVKEQ